MSGVSARRRWVALIALYSWLALMSYLVTRTSGISFLGE
jgi:hypothetical protein